MSAPGGHSGAHPRPVVSVRDIRPIDSQLWAVTVRTDTGQVVTIVVDRQLATNQTVAMAAHVVAMLLKTNRIVDVPSTQKGG